MTPAARVAAAIDVLDLILAGQAAEQALTTWARGSRFAGSKDRAAVRDHVFDVLRCKASLTAAGGGRADGRALMIALLRQQGADLAQIFSGDGYGPPVLLAGEDGAGASVDAVWDQVDVPAWLWPQWAQSLGPQAVAAGQAQQARAPVFLRVNKRLSDVPQAIAALARDDIAVVPHASVPTCLRVLSNPRRIKTSAAYRDGFVEIQDAASQAAVARINVPPKARVLDYCAGGGGKALAIAALHDCAVTAHDIAFERMQDIGPRAARAGVAVTICTTAGLSGTAPFDLVLCDAPCSGSGTWRRTPDSKWRLTADKINQYNVMQAEVLVKSAALTVPGGQVAYMTCSVLHAENEAIVDGFLASHPTWVSKDTLRLLPCDDWDGFYLNILQRQD